MDENQDMPKEDVSECESCKTCGKKMAPEECQTIEFNWRDDPKHTTIKVKPAAAQKSN